MRIDLLGHWTGAALAAIVALLAALLLRAMNRPAVSGLAAPLGVAAGWIVTLGLVTASPRQLPERLPLLALASLAFGLGAAAVAGRQVLLWLVVAIGALGCGWWMAGAPLHGPDVMRAAIPIAAVAGGTLAFHLLLGAAWQPLAAALALALAFAVSTLPGPQFLLALAAACAAAAAWIGGAAPSPALRLPFAMMLAALAAVPPIARGSVMDWIAAAAAPVALLAGPLAARRLPAEAVQVIGAVLAVLPLLLAMAWLAGRLG